MDKLDEARVNLAAMKDARTPIEFQVAFTGFITNCRSSTLKLREAGLPIDGYSQWHEEQYSKLIADDLWKFIHEARNDDFHHVKPQLRFPTTFQSGAIPNTIGGKSMSVELGPRGFQARIDEGTAAERTVLPHGYVSQTFLPCFVNPPKRHKGLPLQSQDPVSVCELALQLAADLVFKARKEFGDLKNS